MKKIKCPKCGSTDTAPIMYGLPVWSDELKQKIESHKISLGGCIVGKDAPDYYCYKCEKGFSVAKEDKHRD